MRVAIVMVLIIALVLAIVVTSARVRVMARLLGRGPVFAIAIATRTEVVMPMGIVFKRGIVVGTATVR